MSCVICHLSFVMCYMSPVICHMSPGPCHLSPVTKPTTILLYYNFVGDSKSQRTSKSHYWFRSFDNFAKKSEFFLLDKVVKLVGGGLLSMARLVFILTNSLNNNKKCHAQMN